MSKQTGPKQQGKRVILFVCRGNQFRSPIAAACLDRLLGQKGMAEEVRVESAGTWTETGLPAHPMAVEAAAKLGLDLGRHRTREVTRRMLAGASLVVVMEEGQKEALEWEFTEARGKVWLLGDLAGAAEQEVPDPARGKFEDGEAVTRRIYQWVEAGWERMVGVALAPRQGEQEES